MRWVVLVFLLLTSGGCAPEQPSSPNATMVAPKPTRIDAASLVGPATNTRKEQAAVDPQLNARQSKLSDARAQIRARDYARQNPGMLPPGLPKSLRNLIPQGIESKVIGFEVHREMKLVRTSPKRLFLRLRLLTLERGEGLRTALDKSLSAAGWGTKGQRLSSPRRVPTLGTLSWTILEPEERPTTIDLKIEADINQHSAPSLATVLRVQPPWWPVVSDTPVGGFEYSWFHGVHLGGVFSDIERVSILYSPAETTSLDQRLYKAVAAAGFRADQDHPRKMRGPDRMSFFVRVQPEESSLVVHHHRRWQHRKPKGQPAPQP